jgi:uncharacterized membrane protein
MSMTLSTVLSKAGDATLAFLWLLTGLLAGLVVVCFINMSTDNSLGYKGLVYGSILGGVISVVVQLIQFFRKRGQIKTE